MKQWSQVLKILTLFSYIKLYVKDSWLWIFQRFFGMLGLWIREVVCLCSISLELEAVLATMKSISLLSNMNSLLWILSFVSWRLLLVFSLENILPITRAWLRVNSSSCFIFYIASERFFCSWFCSAVSVSTFSVSPSNLDLSTSAQSWIYIYFIPHFSQSVWLFLQRFFIWSQQSIQSLVSYSSHSNGHSLKILLKLNLFSKLNVLPVRLLLNSIPFSVCCWNRFWVLALNSFLHIGHRLSFTRLLLIQLLQNIFSQHEQIIRFSTTKRQIGHSNSFVRSVLSPVNSSIESFW